MLGWGEGPRSLATRAILAKFNIQIGNCRPNKKKNGHRDRGEEATKKRARGRGGNKAKSDGIPSGMARLGIMMGKNRGKNGITQAKETGTGQAI